MCLLYVIARMNMYVMFLLRQQRLNKLINNNNIKSWLAMKTFINMSMKLRLALSFAMAVIPGM